MKVEIISKKISPVCLFFALCVVCFSYTSCNSKKQQIQRMQQLEDGVSEPSTIEEISEAIEQYNAHIDDVILSTQQTGIWWKLLGTRYLDNQMYGKALAAFQNAIAVYPANQNLFYYAGVCAGYLAEAAFDCTAAGELLDREYYLNLAESAYLRAIEIEPRFVRALYGLAVLYVFEMNRSKEAIPYLETVLSIETKHTDAMFVLARAFYTTEQYQKAVDMYDTILETTTDKKLKEDAEKNKKVVLDVLYS